MKKTIITLLALAGVAAADTTGAITLWDTGFSVTTTGDNAGQWTLSDEDKALLTSSDWVLKKADGTDLLSTTTNTSELRPNTNVGNVQGWSLDFTLTNNSSTEAITLTSLTFDTLIFAGSGVYQSQAANRDFVFTLTCGDVTLNTGNLTIKGNNSKHPTNGVVTFTLDTAVALAANESIAIGFDVAKGTDNGGCFLGLNSISASGVLVPEPTTATLSLLALAGLAARRRRR